MSNSISNFVKDLKPRIEPPSPGFKDFNICSWNANGLRARIRNKELDFLLTQNGNARYDVVCIQETKSDEVQVEPHPGDKKSVLNKKLPTSIATAYPYRFYKSTRMRKGLNGTAVWSSIKPVRELDPPITDVEGRVTTVEFPSFIVVAVYVPNSGTKHTYRTGLWHAVHSRYLAYLQQLKPTVVCLDSNVCHLDIDIYAPRKYRDKVAGFLDIEREQFRSYLALGYHDTFRFIYPTRTNAYTWYSLRTPKGQPTMRDRCQGWRLDHILVGGIGTVKDAKKVIVQSEIRNDVYGSDHLPISSVLRFSTDLRPINSKTIFDIGWLKPWSPFLDILSAKCKITKFSKDMLLKYWKTKSQQEQKQEQEDNDEKELPYASLFTFAKNNLSTGESEKKQHQTKHYFSNGIFAPTSTCTSVKKEAKTTEFRRPSSS